MTENPIQNEQQISLINFLNVLFKRKNIILPFFITVVVVVTVGSFLLSPIYEANSKLLLEREVESQASLLFRMNLPQRYEKEEWLNSEIEIINSYPVAEQIVKTFGLHELENRKKALTEQQKIKKLKEGIKIFQKKLAVDNIKKSNVIQVSYEAKDPDLAALIVNKVVETYIKYRSEISDESNSYLFFEDQMQIADEKLRNLEQQQADYKSQEKVISPVAQRDILMTRLADYEKNLTEVRTKRIGKEAKLAVIKEQTENGTEFNIPTIETSNSPSREKHIAKLKGELLDMEIRQEKLLQKFTAKYEEVINLGKQIEATKQKILSEIKQIVAMEEATIRAMRAEENALLSSITSIKREIGELARKEYEYSQISRGIDDNKEVYSMLLKQREEARISLAKLERGVKIKIISPAVVPSLPVKPRKRLNVALSLFLGLFGGLGLAFFIEYFDHTLNTPGDLEKFGGVTALGSIRQAKG